MSIVLGGKTAEELKFRVRLASIIPILPTTRDRVVQIPEMNGAHDFGADIGERIFELDCIVHRTNSPAELQQWARDFARHLIDVRGKPKELELRFNIEPDKFYIVRYSGNLPLQRLFTLGEFKLPLIAYDPYAYSDEIITDITTITSPSTLEIESNGSIETSPTLILENEGTSTLTNITLSIEFEIE